MRMRRSVGIVGALALLAIATAADARGLQNGAREASSERSTRSLTVARAVIKAARFCTMSTIGVDGRPQARILDPLEPDDAFTVFFATNPRSRKVAELRANSAVALLYFDSDQRRYVTLMGRAVEASEAEKRTRHKTDWEPFFPRAKPGEYVLYRFEASRVEVVSATDGLSGDPSTWRPEIVELKAARR